MVKVFILFGAPGSGKSTSCEILSSFKISTIKKESTRIARDSDKNEMQTVKTISENCDIRYSQYSNDYGFSSQSIWQKLKQGISVVVIVNDIRTIKILNKKFGSLTHTIYIHSNIDKKKITKISRDRYPNKDSAFLETDVNRRIEKIQTVHRKYIENTPIFDSTIINIYKINNVYSEKLLKNQLQQIYNKKKISKSNYGSPSRVIVIAGASFSGKDNLVNAMIQLDPDKIALYQKTSTRPKKTNDKDELKHVKKIPSKYNIIYSHNGYEYGICSEDVWESLSLGKVALIVLSDLDSIKKIRRDFSDICSVIYLHANTNQEELAKAKSDLLPDEYKKRKDSTDRLLGSYMKNIELFDHVLLNTSESEDLYDQAFNLLDSYLD